MPVSFSNHIGIRLLSICGSLILSIIEEQSMSMGLDTIIIIILVVGAIGGLIYLQRVSAKKQTEPPAAPKK